MLLALKMVVVANRDIDIAIILLYVAILRLTAGL
jgi:hypothetical protein